MSSAETSAPTRAPRPWRRWSLQTRLMIAVIGIVALTLVASAVGIAFTIGTALVAQVSARLETSTTNLKLYDDAPSFFGPTLRTADQVLQAGRQEDGYVLLMRDPTGSLSAAVVRDGQALSLDDEQTEALLAIPQGGFSTVSLEGLGSYHVVRFHSGAVNGIAGLPLSAVNKTVTTLVTIVALITVGGLLLLGGVIAIVIRRSLRPLRAVADTATRVAALPMAQGEVTIAERVPAAEADPHTEIGRVGAALNTLLDHVDASLDARQRNEERMRAFVADASHELRTPLASIRGYSELSLRALAQGAPATAETTQSALERIQAQSLRMTSLVEDLLLLARLDEGQELVYGAVDLTRLAVDAVADAQAAGPDHRWQLVVGDEPVVVAGDASRLHQVVGNLLANARIHTPEDTTVTVSVTAEDGDAVLRVHDDGPGIDPAVSEAIFERFTRADRSRARQTGGTGLGLSIARAIALAHHGELRVDSRPGSTTFELRLAARPADPAGQ